MSMDTEKNQVTELLVRMDCNGCAQRIKKAIHSVDGVYDVHVDLPQHKLTVVGRADPGALVKAIKKTKRVAIIISHTNPSTSEPPSTEPDTSSGAPATQAAEQPPSEPPPAEAPPTDTPKEVPPQEDPVPKKSAEAQGANPTESKNGEDVHMVHNYPHIPVVREHWKNYPPMEHQIHHEAPAYVTHSYNTYMPSPSVTHSYDTYRPSPSVTHSYDTYRPSPYVSEYSPLQSPPQEMRYHSVEAHGDRYHQNYRNEGYYQNRTNGGYYQDEASNGRHYQNGGSDGNQVTSMFSDENPNGCTIA